MDKYIIEGGFPLCGKIRAMGNKNAALPCIAAAILTDEPVILRNIPDIEDVPVMLEIIEELGGSYERLDKNSYSIQMSDIKTGEIPQRLSTKLRASVLFAGSVLAKNGKVSLPPPGGDIIGRRRMDTHFLALSALGGQVVIDHWYHITANKLVGNDIFLDEASVTATENTIMAAVLAEGKTIINNAASEPHVQDLCRMLNGMGAEITGIGSNILTIQGVKKLKGTEFSIGSDFMEVGSYIGLAAITGGELEIEEAAPEHLRMCKIAYNKLGIHWEAEGSTIFVPREQRLKVQDDIGGMVPVIDDAPWPGFPPDLTSIMTVVATQVKGTVLIHEKMFESRMFFVDKLIGMGAKIILCDPHRAVVSGATTLRGSVMVSPDVRAGMAMVLAAMCARGVSEIHNIYPIERGYEDIVRRLRNLGTRITKISE